MEFKIIEIRFNSPLWLILRAERCSLPAGWGIASSGRAPASQWQYLSVRNVRSVMGFLAMRLKQKSLRRVDPAAEGFLCLL